MRITADDLTFLKNSFWTVAVPALVWATVSIYRTTVTTPTNVPVIGAISYSAGLVITVPVLSVLTWLMSAILTVFALSLGSNHVTDRVLPAFGPVSPVFRTTTALLIIGILAFVNITTVILFFKLIALGMEPKGGGGQVRGIQIFEFQDGHDWRWIDPQNCVERMTAFPGIQPNLYWFFVILNWCSALLLLEALLTKRELTPKQTFRTID
jgi:hypothetical protein